MEKNKKKISWRKWAMRAIGLVLLVVIIMRVGREALLSELKSANWLLVSVSALLCGLHFIAKAFRWNHILRRVGVHAGQGQTLKAYCAAALVGDRKSVV